MFGLFAYLLDMQKKKKATTPHISVKFPAVVVFDHICKHYI